MLLVRIHNLHMKPFIFMRLIYLWILRHFHLSCPAVHTYRSLVLLLLGGAELGAAECSEAAGHQDSRHQQPLQGESGAINFDINIQIDSS